MNKFIELTVKDFPDYVGKEVYFNNFKEDGKVSFGLVGYHLGAKPWRVDIHQTYKHAYILNPDYISEPETGKWCKSPGGTIFLLSSISQDMAFTDFNDKQCRYLSRDNEGFAECEQCDDETNEFLDNKFGRNE